jgi:hypothetical protein
MRNWRDDPVGNSHIWAYVYYHIERLYPGRFITLGDIADTTDAEFLAMPGIGARKLEMLRGVVADAKSARSAPLN